MARFRRSKQIIPPRQCAETGYPGYPYFKKPTGWKPAQEIRLEMLIKKYKAKRQSGKPFSAFDVLDVYWRNNMTISETATILATDERTIEDAIETIRNDAR